MRNSPTNLVDINILNHSKNSFRLAWKITVMGSNHYTADLSKELSPQIQTLIDGLEIQYDYLGMSEIDKHDNLNDILRQLIFLLDTKYGRKKNSPAHTYLLSANLLSCITMIRENRAKFDAVKRAMKMLSFLPNEYILEQNNIEKEYLLALEGRESASNISIIADKQASLSNKIAKFIENL